MGQPGKTLSSAAAWWRSGVVALVRYGAVAQLMAETGRQQIMRRLNAAVARASTGDLQRAAEFLEFAKRVRDGCTYQRRTARRRQAELRDPPLGW